MHTHARAHTHTHSPLPHAHPKIPAPSRQLMAFSATAFAAAKCCGEHTHTEVKQGRSGPGAARRVHSRQRKGKADQGVTRRPRSKACDWQPAYACAAGNPCVQLLVCLRRSGPSFWAHASQGQGQQAIERWRRLGSVCKPKLWATPVESISGGWAAAVAQAGLCL